MMRKIKKLITNKRCITRQANFAMPTEFSLSFPQFPVSRKTFATIEGLESHLTRTNFIAPQKTELFPTGF